MDNQLKHITGTQAGFPEIEQMKFALELILKQGGIATMSQIYDAVNERLDENTYLSDQGKHTLRRIVNTRAVKAGYLLPYDDKMPGWQITDSGESFITNQLGYSVGTIRITARALVNANLALKDIRGLLDFYQEAKKNGQKEEGLEFFKRTSIILLVTVWETYFEDVFRICVKKKLEKATSPTQLQKAFNTIAGEWYVGILQKQAKHKPTDFIKWTGDNWKQLIENNLIEELDKLNTPDSGNVAELSERYLGTNLTETWTWNSLPSSEITKQLDILIKTRGELVHRIGNYFESGKKLKVNYCFESLIFIKKLIEQTEIALLNLI